MQRVPLASRWLSEKWEAAAVEPLPPTMEVDSLAPTRIEDGSGVEKWRWPRQEIELHRSEAEGYYLNLSTATPKVFVMWRATDPDGSRDVVAPKPLLPPVAPVIVTLSYGEAARFLEVGEQVDTVPISAPLHRALAAFVALHYQGEPRKKVRRNDPFGDGSFVRGPR